MAPEDGDPEVVFCVDEFGPLNLQPRPGRQWAAVSGKGKEPGRAPRPRMRATYTRTAGVRHLFAAYGAGRGQAVRAHQAAQDPGPVPGVLPLPALPLPARHPDRDHLRQLQPAPDHRARTPGSGPGPTANNVEIAYTPTNSSWLNRIEAQFTALRYFTLDGTDHASHKEQASMIRRYIIWRNNHAYDERLRRIVDQGKRSLMRH